MRSRERLIEVMQSVNPRVYVEAAMMLHAAARHFTLNPGCWACKRDMEDLKADHKSPHIRELAAEALHYLNGGN